MSATVRDRVPIPREAYLLGIALFLLVATTNILTPLLRTASVSTVPAR